MSDDSFQHFREAGSMTTPPTTPKASRPDLWGNNHPSGKVIHSDNDVNSDNNKNSLIMAFIAVVVVGLIFLIIMLNSGGDDTTPPAILTCKGVMSNYTMDDTLSNKKGISRYGSFSYVPDDASFIITPGKDQTFIGYKLKDGKYDVSTREELIITNTQHMITSPHASVRSDGLASAFASVHFSTVEIVVNKRVNGKDNIFGDNNLPSFTYMPVSPFKHDLVVGNIRWDPVDKNVFYVLLMRGGQPLCSIGKVTKGMLLSFTIIENRIDKKYDTLVPDVPDQFEFHTTLHIDKNDLFITAKNIPSQLPVTNPPSQLPVVNPLLPDYKSFIQHYTRSETDSGWKWVNRIEPPADDVFKNINTGFGESISSMSFEEIDSEGKKLLIVTSMCDAVSDAGTVVDADVDADEDDAEKPLLKRVGALIVFEKEKDKNVFIYKNTVIQEDYEEYSHFGYATETFTNYLITSSHNSEKVLVYSVDKDSSEFTLKDTKESSGNPYGVPRNISCSKIRGGKKKSLHYFNGEGSINSSTAAHLNTFSAECKKE